ncbi:MAG: hypothetical protein ABIM54_00855 [candidate division WOR-3 bacterium]
MPEISPEVKKFLEDLGASIEAAKADLKKAQELIKIGEEMGFDVTEQKKRQEELLERIKKMEEVREKYLKG